MIVTYLLNRNKEDARIILDQAGMPEEVIQQALRTLEGICIGIDVLLLLLVFFIIN